MNINKTLLAGIISCSMLLTGSALAEGQKSVVMKIKTDDLGMVSSDLSDLEVGDAKTIVTESGKTVDMLRTEEGFEIYIDGELMEMPHMAAGHAGDMHKRKIRVECTGDAECEERHVIVIAGEDELTGDELADIESNIEIHKVIEIHADTAEDINIEELHEVIRISGENGVVIDGEVDHATKVIVIQHKDTGDEI